jgi:pyruvate/2-oxoacid:ferredoxin oxidoreductase alpha subunit/NAD-dependent dihydropyrimidine dehydrogenase PreA subunit
MVRERSQVVPALQAEHCKGCSRCVEACARGCISEGTVLHPASGLVPVTLDLARCNGCGLCVEACPEPYALVPSDGPGPFAEIPPPAAGTPDRRVPLPATRPMLMKGNHAAAVGALLAGCRHFFGYPITPSTEGAELMAKLLPELGGTYLQAASEVAAVNLMYGCAGAGRRTMTFTSGPGFSLMLEGISYLIGAELPGVFVNVMRAGPGLGNIGPEQADVKLACRGLGHGNTHAPVLAPASPQEMLDLTMLAFELAFRWRTPVIVLADGVLGQMSGRVALPAARLEPGLPAWAVCGDAGHRRNLHCSIQLRETDQEAHNLRLIEKYRRMGAEARVERFRCQDADTLVIACNSPARAARGAVEALRADGIAAGLFRPVTIWPFPVRELAQLAARARRIVVVEASDGQLEDEARLALSHAGAGAGLAWSHVRHHGGVLPTQAEIVEAVRSVAQPGMVAA